MTQRNNNNNSNNNIKFNYKFIEVGKAGLYNRFRSGGKWWYQSSEQNHESRVDRKSVRAFFWCNDSQSSNQATYAFFPLEKVVAVDTI